VLTFEDYLKPLSIIIEFCYNMFLLNKCTSANMSDIGVLPGIKFETNYEIPQEVPFLSPVTVNVPTKLIGR
jgi:hypothetical protein